MANLTDSAAAWSRWLRDPSRSHNPNAYDLLADLLDLLASGATRDCFAAQAMQGICVHPDTWGLDRVGIAAKSYQIADEMIAASSAPSPKESLTQYRDGHRAALEWAVEVVTAKSTLDKDWLFKDRLELAAYLSQGPDEVVP